MKKVPSNVVKKRSRELTSIFEAFTPYNGMEGRLERIWITEIATDGIHLVRLGKCLNAFFCFWIPYVHLVFWWGLRVWFQLTFPVLQHLIIVALMAY